MSSLHRTQIFLEDAQIAALDARARALGVTRSDLIRTIVDHGLAQVDLKPSLYDVVQRIAGSANKAGRTGIAQDRQAFEAEFSQRHAAWQRRRVGADD